MIAGIAAIGAFVAAGVMASPVALGVVHHAPHPQDRLTPQSGRTSPAEAGPSAVRVPIDEQVGTRTSTGSRLTMTRKMCCRPSSTTNAADHILGTRTQHEAAVSSWVANRQPWRSDRRPDIADNAAAVVGLRRGGPEQRPVSRPLPRGYDCEGPGLRVRRSASRAA